MPNSLSAYKTIPWQLGEPHSVDFVSQTFFDVILISTSSPDRLFTRKDQVTRISKSYALGSWLTFSEVWRKVF
jgi:hypothetical protein